MSMGDENNTALLLSFTAVETMEVVLHEVFGETDAVSKPTTCPRGFGSATTY